VPIVAIFEMLLDEIEAEIEFVNKIDAKTFEEGSYDCAKEALEHVAAVWGHGRVLPYGIQSVRGVG
jgi:hypothetical protein